ncbi:ligase-associated DNA damage response endonuclease PdeM [Pedobacter sp. ASV28]|uniref:ligase-associated DNA damage response endonuclease PdeM n=1 Tax=Pedobacter sp. ASV28 TaxID=2795123 RepID=UPI0018EDD2D9|nr:ligase-associated DNA damage response endonuclease PdeM [Pedobacter sp. ASV28]
MKITIREEELILAKERAVYFIHRELLAISDFHIGKAAHFRKAGLPVPATTAQSDLQRLSSLLTQYQPKTLLINGDMFHSDHNQEIDDFGKWKENFPSIDLVLVKGNHDKQDEKLYQELGIQLHDPSYCTDKFCFIHEAFKCKEKNLYPISGHIHPGIAIYNNAKQRLKFPCFYFGEAYGILPAFSTFTGLSLIKAKSNEQVFAITPNKVIKV